MGGAPNRQSGYVLDAADIEAGTRVPFLRTVDPRSRIIAVVLFALVVVSLNSFAALLMALVVALIALVHVRLPVVQTLKQMIAMDMFMVFLILSLPFTTPGPVAFMVLGWPASWAGIESAFRIGLIANAIVLAMLVLVGTIGPVQFGHALARLKVPPMLVHLLLFTVRYIDVLNDEYKRLRVAMKTRGFAAKTDMHTAKTLGYLLGMLLIRAVDRSERILKAMKCRGFCGQFPILDEMRFVPERDYPFAVVAAVVIGSLVLLEEYHVFAVV